MGVVVTPGEGPADELSSERQGRGASGSIARFGHAPAVWLFGAALAIARVGNLRRIHLQLQLTELRTEAGIYTYTVYLRVPEEALWERIQKRLVAEP